MVSSTIRAVVVLLYLGLSRIALSASIPVLTSPSDALWQPVGNVTEAQNVTFSHIPPTIPTPNPLGPPEGSYIIHAYQSPISVVFSRYRPPIPGPALYRTYQWVVAEAMSKGTRRITESHTWEREARLYLWPRPTMTWDQLATAILVFDEFARTVGRWGFRFDVFDRNMGVMGHGAVFGYALRGGGAVGS